MKKFMFLIMLMFSMSVFGQKVDLHKVKQSALNKFRSTLIAPSQFILTDYYGNRIGVDAMEATYHKGGVKDECIDSVFYYRRTQSPIRFRDTVSLGYPDSIKVYKKVREVKLPYYTVKIIGDARTVGGGFKQCIEYYYVVAMPPYSAYDSRDVEMIKTYKYCIGTIVCEENIRKNNERMERMKPLKKETVYDTYGWDD